MQCDRCGKEAVISPAYSARHLCRQHFLADVERRAKHEIRLNRWLQPGDHIAVALSGDAGSSALLRFLDDLTADRRDVRLSAITIDEGIAGYRDPGVPAGLAAEWGIFCLTASFEDRFGVTTDAIAGQRGTGTACQACRALRKELLGTTAALRGVTRIALGEDLDDAARRVLEHFLAGTPERVIRPAAVDRQGIMRIRPFGGIPGEEVRLYAHLRGIPYTRVECPYRTAPSGGIAERIAQELSARNPSARFALRRLQRDLDRTCQGDARISCCEQCGEPADGLCADCRLIGEVTGGT